MAEILVTRITGLDELIRKTSDPELMGVPIRKFLNTSLLTLADLAAQNTPRNSGRLIASITDAKNSINIDPSPLPLYGSLSTPVDYAVYVEEDTRPHWPPFAPILELVRLNRGKFGMITASRNLKRGKKVDADVRRIAYFVSRKIARFGTTGKHMFQKALLTYSIDNRDDYLDECIREIENRWGK